MDLLDILRILHSADRKYTMLSATMEVSPKQTIFQNTKQVVTHNKIEISSHILSDQNEIKLEINSTRNYKKYTDPPQLDNALQNNQWAMKEIMNEVKFFFVELNENENKTYQSTRHDENDSKRRVYNYA